MNKTIISLYPPSPGQNAGQQPDSVRGLYLRKNLHLQGFTIYADFLSSLDGRISISHGEGHSKESILPKSITSADDFRLLLELQAQADCIVTHGGYLRSRQSGALGDVLSVGTQAGHEDLAEWRRAQGLSEQPLVVVCSASLNFPPPDNVSSNRVQIITGGQSDAKRIDEWRERGYHVVTTNDKNWVSGVALTAHLKSIDVNGVFLLAGPTLFESLIATRGIQHLFLTMSHRLVGSPEFHTMMPGVAQFNTCRLAQKELFYVSNGDNDADAPAQWFAHFECLYD